MPKGKNKHLTIQDRIEIENGINERRSFASIARKIGVSTSTVSREVKQNRDLHIPKGRCFNVCLFKRSCRVENACNSSCELGICRTCRKVKCYEVCSEFEEHFCSILENAPFVCGDCYRRGNCGFRHADYYAVKAQEKYEIRLAETRDGISLAPKELEVMIKVVKAQLIKGQSFEAICTSNNPLIKVSSRTLYRYAEAGIFGIANIDLPRKVRYKVRKTRIRVDRPVDRDGRCYSNFLELTNKEKLNAVQMDTVIGLKTDRKCILTIHFPKMEFQLHLLLDYHNSDCVIGVIDFIEHLIGVDAFRKHFGVILTDRGIEFGDFRTIERSIFEPTRRCKVFYCDAMASHQKASCEKNHVELRRILPKKTSFERLTPYEMATISSHINNYPRKSLGGKTPYSLAAKTLPKELLDGIGVGYVAPKDVTLKPSILK